MAYQFVGFGEAMIRYAPQTSVDGLPDSVMMLRTVGGDELNVAVALTRLQKPGVTAKWISVLPGTPAVAGPRAEPL